MAKRGKKKGGLFRGLKKLLGFMLVLAIAWFALGFVPGEHNYLPVNPLLKQHKPILVAHGGGSREFPENTLEAFYNAYSADPHMMLETDVCLTADGVLILSHDTTLDRKTDASGAIADWTYADLMAQQVDFGWDNPVKDGQLNGQRMRFSPDGGSRRTPADVTYPAGVQPRHRTKFLATTLEEVLIAFPETRISVEIKQEGDLGLKAVDETLRLLEKHDAFHRVVLASYHNEVYRHCLQLQDSGSVPDTFLLSPSLAGVVRYVLMAGLNLDFLFRDGIAVLQLPTSYLGIPLATRWLVDSAHSHNIAVHFWTVNDVSEMQHLIDIGADGITTDYPHLLRQVLDAQPDKADDSALRPGETTLQPGTDPDRPFGDIQLVGPKGE